MIYVAMWMWIWWGSWHISAWGWTWYHIDWGRQTFDQAQPQGSLEGRICFRLVTITVVRHVFIQIISCFKTTNALCLGEGTAEATWFLFSYMAFREISFRNRFTVHCTYCFMRLCSEQSRAWVQPVPLYGACTIKICSRAKLPFFVDQGLQLSQWAWVCEWWRGFYVILCLSLTTKSDDGDNNIWFWWCRSMAQNSRDSPYQLTSLSDHTLYFIASS